jgi:hypothetical protein
VVKHPAFLVAIAFVAVGCTLPERFTARDSGARDVGTRDAGARDARPRDARLADVGIRDASTADGSPDPCSSPPEFCAVPVYFECGSPERCYVLCPDRVSWGAASEACEGWGGCLVDIDSASESECVGRQLDATDGGVTISWVDYVQIGDASVPESGWGPACSVVTVQAVNWLSDEPDDDDNTENHEEDCATISDGVGYWLDRRCMQPFGFVCERAR